MWTLLRWVVILAVLVWAGYSVAVAGWSYITTQDVVDKTLRDVTPQYRAALSTGTQTDAMTRQIRDSIVLAARHQGLSVQADDIDVSANSAGITATVRWSYPLIRFQDTEVLVIPLSIRRSYTP